MLRPFCSLRPYGFAIVWLLFFEAGLRLSCRPDGRVIHSPLPAYGCMADDELERLLAARKSPAQTLDVVLIGDSVLGSINNRPGERLADVLSSSPLAHSLSATRPVRVFSLCAGGARAADVYAMVRRLQNRLQSSPRGNRDLYVVLSSNLIFFSRRHSQPEMLFPCLREPADGALEHRLARWLAAHVYLYQQRRRLAEFLFGGPPRPALRQGLQAFVKRHSRAETAAEIVDYRQYAPNYDFIPLHSPEARNYQSTQQMAQWLAVQRRLSGLRALVILAPHNHVRLGSITDTAAYRDLSAALADLFQGAGVPFASYDRDPVFIPEMFLDLDHLTAAGNRALAARIVADLAKLEAVQKTP